MGCIPNAPCRFRPCSCSRSHYRRHYATGVAQSSSGPIGHGNQDEGASSLQFTFRGASSPRRSSEDSVAEEEGGKEGGCGGEEERKEGEGRRWAIWALQEGRLQGFTASTARQGPDTPGGTPVGSCSRTSSACWYPSGSGRGNHHSGSIRSSIPYPIRGMGSPASPASDWASPADAGLSPLPGGRLPALLLLSRAGLRALLVLPPGSVPPPATRDITSTPPFLITSTSVVRTVGVTDVVCSAGFRVRAELFALKR